MSTVEQLISAMKDGNVRCLGRTGEVQPWVYDRNWLVPCFDFGFEFEPLTPERDRLMEEVQRLQSEGNLHLPASECVFVFHFAGPAGLEAANLLRIEERDETILIECVDWLSRAPDYFLQLDLKILIAKPTRKDRPFRLGYTGSHPSLDAKMTRLHVRSTADHTLMGMAAILLSGRASGTGTSSEVEGSRSTEERPTAKPEPPSRASAQTFLSVSLTDAVRQLTSRDKGTNSGQSPHMRRERLSLFAKRARPGKGLACDRQLHP